MSLSSKAAENNCEIHVEMVIIAAWSCIVDLWTVNASGLMNLRMGNLEKEGPRENLGFDVFSLSGSQSHLFLTSFMPAEIVFNALLRAPCSSLHGRSISSVCSHSRPHSETHGD